MQRRFVQSCIQERGNGEFDRALVVTLFERLDGILNQEKRLGTYLPTVDKAADVLRATIETQQKIKVGNAFVVSKSGGLWPQQGAYTPHAGQSLRLVHPIPDSERLGNLMYFRAHWRH